MRKPHANPDSRHHHAVLEVQLDPNESVFSESGELSWMTQSIQMTTHTQMGGGGGLLGVFKRMAAGGTLFMTEYRAMPYPRNCVCHQGSGHIVPVQVGQGAEYMVHRHGFLCATPQVTLSIGFQQNLGARSSAATDHNFFCSVVLRSVTCVQSPCNLDTSYPALVAAMRQVKPIPPTLLQNSHHSRDKCPQHRNGGVDALC